MSERQDIYCAAHVLIAVYGDDAMVDAAMRAQELAAAGDSEGASLWRQILAAIDQRSTICSPTSARSARPSSRVVAGTGQAR